MFTRHGLKTEVLHTGHQREDLDIELEGKKLTQRDSFVYLGGAVCGDGKTGERYVEEYDFKTTKWQGHEHLCHTGMPVRNRNIGTD